MVVIIVPVVPPPLAPPTPPAIIPRDGGVLAVPDPYPDPVPELPRLLVAFGVL